MKRRRLFVLVVGIVLLMACASARADEKPDPAHLSIGARAMNMVGKLAPLSIVIAALGFLHNLRQARIKRDRDDAIAVREVFNKLGTKAYLLNWTLIGRPPSLIAAAVLRIRESIEARVGKTPSTADLGAFLSEQLLAEGTAERAMQDSKVLEKFQTDALDFGKLRSDLGNRVPLVQSAIGEIERRLRVLFLLNTFVVMALRDDPGIKALKQGAITGQSEPLLSLLHGRLVRATVTPDKDTFSSACKVLEVFCNAVTGISDKRLLSLVRRRPLHRRIADWWSARALSRSESVSERQLLERLKKNASAQFALLAQVVAEISQEQSKNSRADHLLRRSALRIRYVFRRSRDASALQDAMEEFVRANTAEWTEDVAMSAKLLQLRAEGVDDPDIDALLASKTNVVELLKSALDRGANRSAGDLEVLRRHSGARKPAGDAAEGPRPVAADG